jgi:OOP family OmpA-OmpF porin
MRIRSILFVLVCALAIPATGWADDEEPQPGVTDFTNAKPEVIDVEELTYALSATRSPSLEAPATARLPILFLFGSAQLTSDTETLLGKVAVSLNSSELDTFQFSLEGHTDDVGSDQYNEELSKTRAAAVKDFLIDRGVPDWRLEAMGHGERSPFMSNTTDEGRTRNRRVDVVNRGVAKR